MAPELRRPGTTYDEAPEPIGASMLAVQNFGESLSRLLSIPTAPKLDAVVGALGGRVNFTGWEFGAPSGTIYVHGAGDFDIVVTDETSPARERFTIAHELGHYFLHSKCGEHLIIAPRDTTLGRGGRLEWEANWFAAGLLMPSAEFKRALKDLHGDLERVAAQFFVSPKAAQIRASVLGR